MDNTFINYDCFYDRNLNSNIKLENVSCIHVIVQQYLLLGEERTERTERFLQEAQIFSGERLASCGEMR